MEKRGLCTGGGGCSQQDGEDATRAAPIYAQTHTHTKSLGLTDIISHL